MRAFRRGRTRHLTDLLWTGRKGDALAAVEELRRRWYEDSSLRAPRPDDRAPYHTLDDLITYLRSRYGRKLCMGRMKQAAYPWWT